MNWGYKILTAYLVFVAGILFMVFKTSGGNSELVTTDYYAQELKYQERIDQVKRTESLSGEVSCTITGNKLDVRFPADFKGKKLDGSITLYCPSDKNKDLKQSFTLTDETAAISLPAGYTGLFELHLAWAAEGQTYYFEKKLFI